MDSMTAEARGSSDGLPDEVCEDLLGEAWMAFSVRERIAFWDFLVPKARPRAVRAETF